MCPGVKRETAGPKEPFRVGGVDSRIEKKKEYKIERKVTSRRSPF